MQCNVLLLILGKLAFLFVNTEMRFTAIILLHLLITYYELLSCN